MAQTGAGLQAGAQGEAVAFPLIGVEGTDYVSNLLTANPPQVATRNIQKAAGLQQPLCAPLLGLLDQLGISRYDAHMGMLKAAKKALLYQVNSAMDTIKLERLLQASFNYLGIQELKDVPLAVMEKLEQVPTVHLKQLALDKAIFRELPAKVQRQVWEYDKNLLQADALPPVGRYKYETATIMRGLAMDEFLPAAAAALAAARPGKADGKGARAGKGAGDDSDDESAGGLSLPRTGSGLGRGGGRRSGGGPSSGGRGGVPAPRPVTRKILRKGSYVVQLLRSMVGSSPKIYSQIVELCMVKYRDSDVLYVGSKEASYCTLRANLLMALHDVNSPVAEKDRCHELAWTLDAGITNGFLTEKHIAKLTKFFDDMQQTESAIASRLAEAKRKNKDKPVQDEAESAGNVLGGGAVEPYLALGDASVILRDPSAQHLLAGAVFQMVLPAALEGKLPSELPGLPGLLRMMTLGVEGRTMLRERKYRFPTVDQRLIHDLLPLLCSWALIHEAEPSKSNAELQGPTIKWGVPKEAVSVALDLLPISEVARRLTQTFAVGRLLEQDWLGATRACKLLATALHKSLPAIQQGWDFAGTMAMRLADLIKAGVLFPQSSLFYWAVQQLIIYAVDAHTQVHEEILRLLLAAAPQLQPEELGEFLELTMKHSKKSRRRLVKKGLQEPSFSGFPGMAFSAEMGSDIGSDIGSDGWAGIHNLKLRAGDGVRSVYKEFLKLPNVTAAHAPELHKYLSTDGDQELAKG